MTWRNWGWRGGYRWFLVAFTVFVIAMLAVLYLDDETPGSVQLIVAVALLASLVLMYVAHPWITVRPGEVRLGYFPFYRRTLPMREIQELTEVTVDPVRQFSGYGVRGLAKTSQGLLLGGYPSEGLKFETVDDRRYIITLKDHQPVVQELARYGVTLSAVNGEDVSREL